MKNSLLSQAAIMLFVVFVFVRCSDEEQKPTPGTIPFSFSFSTAEMNSDQGRVGGMEEISAALITLTNSAGDQVILNKKQINIYQYGDSYVTESVPLKPARYVITEFMLIDSEQNVIYATPVKGSALANHVEQPLPIAFVVSKNSVKKIDMQVTSTDGHAPSDFGYAAFGIDLMMSFQLSAMLAQNDSVNLTDAEVVIREANKQRYTGEYIVHTQHIGPTVNRILFSGDDNTLYTLLISKEGYGTYSRNFTFRELQEELNGQPMVVTFTPSVNITMQPYFYSDFYVSFVVGSTKPVTVDWGDGTRDTGTGRFDHTYVDDAYYAVTITGGLDGVYQFLSDGYQGLPIHMDTDQLVNLASFTLTNTEGPNHLDLSHNLNLRTLRIEMVYNGIDITLPETHSISYISLDESYLQDGELDEIIESALMNAYFNPNMLGGTFSFSKNETEMIAQPSPNSMFYLSELKSSFGWTIEPDIDLPEPE